MSIFVRIIWLWRQYVVRITWYLLTSDKPARDISIDFVSFQWMLFLLSTQQHGRHEVVSIRSPHLWQSSKDTCSTVFLLCFQWNYLFFHKFSHVFWRQLFPTCISKQYCVYKKNQTIAINTSWMLVYLFRLGLMFFVCCKRPQMNDLIES